MKANIQQSYNKDIYKISFLGNLFKSQENT